MAVATSMFAWAIWSGRARTEAALGITPRISAVQEGTGQTHDELSPSALDQIVSFNDFGTRNATLSMLSEISILDARLSTPAIGAPS
jgi:hypothetical protein